MFWGTSSRPGCYIWGCHIYAKTLKMKVRKSQVMEGGVERSPRDWGHSFCESAKEGKAWQVQGPSGRSMWQVDGELRLTVIYLMWIWVCQLREYMQSISPCKTFDRDELFLLRLHHPFSLSCQFPNICTFSLSPKVHSSCKRTDLLLS